MKKILALILSAILCFSAIGTVYAAEFNFTDVKASDWFYNDVKSAVEMGLVNGKTATELIHTLIPVERAVPPAAESV